MLGVQPMLGRVFSRTDDAPGSPETVDPDIGILAVEIRRRQLRDRPHADARQPPARNHRRAARYVPLPRPQRLARRAVPVRSQQGVSRAIQLFGHRAAETGHHDRPGERRRRAHDSDLAHPLPAVSGRQRQDVRRGAPRAERPLAQGRPRRRRANGVVGADGDDRDGAPHRVRERREPAPRQSRVAAAGAGDSCRARRRLGTDRPRAAAGKRHARHPRRHRRARPGVRRAAAAGGAGAGEPAAARRHHARCPRAALHACAVGGRRSAVRRDPGVQVRARPARHDASRRRTDRRARAGNAIARATRSSSRRSRWRSCSSSARG